MNNCKLCADRGFEEPATTAVVLYQSTDGEFAYGKYTTDVCDECASEVREID